MGLFPGDPHLADAEAFIARLNNIRLIYQGHNSEPDRTDQALNRVQAYNDCMTLKHELADEIVAKDTYAAELSTENTELWKAVAKQSDAAGMKTFTAGGFLLAGIAIGAVRHIYGIEIKPMLGVVAALPAIAYLNDAFQLRHGAIEGKKLVTANAQEQRIVGRRKQFAAKKQEYFDQTMQDILTPKLRLVSYSERPEPVINTGPKSDLTPVPKN